MDVKFLKLKSTEGGTVRRFQYTSIDEATRIRALKVYNYRNQQSAFMKALLIYNDKWCILVKIYIMRIYPNF